MPENEDAYDIEPGDEPSAPPPDKSVHGLDTCPNCSAPMRGTDTLICLRCGYDLKTMEVVETRTSEAEAAEDPEDLPPLVHAGGPTWLPGAMLAGGLLVLVVATLVGWPGLFPVSDGAEGIPFPERLYGLARLPVLLGAWTACATGALIVVAWLHQREFGDVPLAIGRAAGISAIAMTALLVRVPWRFGEVAVECVGATAIFFVLAIVLFRLTPRRAGQAALFALVAFVVLVVGARIIVWAV